MDRSIRVSNMSKYQSVLLVDDDPSQIAILKSYFTALKVDTILDANNPKRALEIIENRGTDIDLIVSDLQMPGMDGIEFMRHLKDRQFSGDYSIISGVRGDLLEHAGRLASMHKLNLIGQLSKPLTKQGLDRLFVNNPSSGNVVTGERSVEMSTSRLTRAIERQNIRPYYQPKVDLKSGTIIGAEALARWITDDGESISPESFIEFAEQSGLIEPLTFQMFEMVLQDIPVFLNQSPNVKISINVSPKMICDRSLPDRLSETLDRYGMTSKNISLEITENCVINPDVDSLEVMSRLRVLGFELAVDDFGIGSSNIQTLRDFPYSELKIDRSFVSNVTTSKFSAETVKLAIKLARDLGMRIVAEGVETTEIWHYLKDAGVEHAQGYLIAKALPPADFSTFLKMHKASFHFSTAQTA